MLFIHYIYIYIYIYIYVWFTYLLYTLYINLASDYVCLLEWIYFKASYSPNILEPFQYLFLSFSLDFQIWQNLFSSTQIYDQTKLDQHKTGLHFLVEHACIYNFSTFKEMNKLMKVLKNNLYLKFCFSWNSIC